MASVINTNMASLYAQKNLSGAQSALSTSVERLSSGLRINRAKDDAAGLGISEKLKSQIVALNQGVRNANDAVSMVQTAEGSLSEVSNILQRMKELAVQGRNESLSDVQRAYIADELTALKKEVNAIAERTSFNGMSLLKNALRTQVASAMGATNKMVEGAQILDGLSITGLKVDGANVGNYSIQTQVSQVVASASNASAADTTNPLTARTVTINPGDVFEGAKLTVSINGIDYSAVAGQDTTATQLANQLVTKLNRDYSSNVSASNGVITFASNVSLGGADIGVSLSTLSASSVVENVRSTVDAPYDAAATARVIQLNDFDIIEGRKVTVRIGNPEEVAEFSTIIGAGATKTTVAEDLEDLIDAHFSHTSAASGAITFASNANLGMAEISLTFEETSAVRSNLTVSTVSDKDGLQTARTIEINENDIEFDPNVSRVFSLTVDGKEYATKVQDGDTDSTVAYRLSQLLQADYPSTAGVAVAPTIAITNGVDVSDESASVDFNAMSAGDSVTVAGLTFTANTTLLASQVAEAFSNLQAGATAKTGIAYGNYSGTLTGYDTGVATTDDVVFTSTTLDSNVGDLTPASAQGAASDLTANGVTVNGDGTTNETHTVTFASAGGNGMRAGDTVTIGGLTYTATQDNSLAELVAAFSGLQGGDTGKVGISKGTYSGTLAAGWASVGTSSAVVTFTYTTDANNATDITTARTARAIGTAAASTLPTATITQGGTTSNTAQDEVAVLTFDSNGMKKGDSITVGGLRFTATSTVSRAQAVAAFANLMDGAVSGDGTEYGTYSGVLRGWTSGNGSATAVSFTSVKDNENVPNLTVSANPVTQAVTRAGNTITLTAAGAKLGLSDIDLKVKTVTNPGVITITAANDTGVGGVSQSINVGSIASGATKNYVFDQLGVSFGIKNSRSTAVNEDLFEVYNSKLDTLSVTSDMNGEALFQVGAAVRDTVVIDGFKDIRITGASKNDTQAEREVFDNLYTTMTAIAGGDVDEATFATLETQVEEAITTVSTFRSYLGAQQNRIDYAIANLQAQSENITEANSRIRDTDYAAETANLTKTQIMQQAATAMLAQANQMPNVILALLK